MKDLTNFIYKDFLRYYPCDVSYTGISRDCNRSRGGILEVWIAARADITINEEDIDDTTHTITAITANPVNAFKKYEVEPFTSNYVTNPNPSPETNGLDVQTVLTMVFARITAAKQREFQELSKDGASVLVKDANKTWVYLGLDEPLYMTDGSQIETGTARADLNGYTIELTDYSNEVPYVVPESVVQGLINPTTPEAAKATVDITKVKKA